jgi:hypothetical protein
MNTHNEPTSTEDKIQAAAFRKLLRHLDEHKEVQNIELMNLADFCRNCLSKWYMAAADELAKKSIMMRLVRKFTACHTVNGKKSINYLQRQNN